MRFRIIAVLVATFLLTLRANALDHSGSMLHLPIVSHVPGANNTQWRSDLVLINRHSSLPTIADVTYYPNGADSQSITVPLLPLQTVTLRDVVGDAFASPGTYGTMTIASLNPSIPIRAHARVYNVGNSAGEFGQSFTALPFAQLGDRLWLYGMNGVGGNRTNVGIANPNDAAVSFSLSWYDKEGESHGGLGSISIPAHGVVLINDIFHWLDQPYDEAMTLRITSAHRLYAYASVVRNDSGDAYTLFAEEAQ